MSSTLNSSGKTNRIYADYNATSPMRPEARESVSKALELPANASSVHSEGRKARGMIENARRQVAGLVNADPELVWFTSGATEAIATICQSGRGGQIHALATEHAAVLQGHGLEEAKVQLVEVTSEGKLASMPKAEDGDLIAVQMANSETGVLQDTNLNLNQNMNSGPSTICFRDAVQAAGKLPVDFSQMDADLICISSHKLGGPQGAAAIIARNHSVFPPALIRGGGQEKGRRGGTENTAALAGFGAACEAVSGSMEAEQKKCLALREELEVGLADIAAHQGLEFAIHGKSGNRLANTSCFSFAGLEAATALMAADLNGIALSSGSACSSGKVGKSHVLKAMGISDEMSRGALRVSFGWSSGAGDAAALLNFLDKELPRLLS